MILSPPKVVGAALLAAVLVCANAEPAFSQASPPEKSQAPQAPSPESSQALLQKVKQTEMERRIADKQTEIDRLKADLDQSKKDLDASQKNLDSTNALITESNANMDKLAAERSRLEHQLELTDLRIDAEQKQGDGLKKLSGAQTSELEAINLRMAEIDVQSRIRQSELELLSAGQPVPGEDNDENGTGDLLKLKKTLASDELKTASAEAIAREAMKAASARMELAQQVAARVKQASEAPAEGKPEPVGEKTGEMAPPSKPAVSPAPKHHRKSASPKPAATASVSPASSSPRPWWQKKEWQ